MKRKPSNTSTTTLEGTLLGDQTPLWMWEATAEQIREEHAEEVFYIPFQGPSKNADLRWDGALDQTQGDEGRGPRDRPAIVYTGSRLLILVALQFVPVVGRREHVLGIIDKLHLRDQAGRGRLVAAGILVDDDTSRYVQSIRVYQPVVDQLGASLALSFALQSQSLPRHRSGRGD